MITQLLVIQKISDAGKVEVFQIASNNFQWTFENRRPKINTDKEYFPFVLNGDVSILKRDAGAETKSFITRNKLTFYDDYGVPSGTVVAILFPKYYIPDIIKFKDKPFIPTGMAGQVTTTPPGQIQVLYNYLEKRCTIIFNIHHAIVFGFKCSAKLVNDEDFPRGENVLVDDLFDTTLSREFLDIAAITTKDLKIINETFNQADLVGIQDTLNNLLNAVKAGENQNNKPLLDKLGTMLINSTGVSSSLTTIADSYNAGGSAHQFIGRVLEYLSL